MGFVVVPDGQRSGRTTLPGTVGHAVLLTQYVDGVG